MKKLNLNTASSADSGSKPKSIPFLTTSKEDGKKEVSILDDMAFLNSIRNKYTGGASEAPTRPPPKDADESIEMKSKELIEQLLRQDKISKEKEKQRRNKEKQREKDKKERDRIRQEKRRDKLERREKLEKEVSDLFSSLAEPTKQKTKTSKASATSKLKKEFKSNFVKAAEGFEGTLMKSTIDNTVLPAERLNEVEEFDETKEHRYWAILV